MKATHPPGRGAVLVARLVVTPTVILLLGLSACDRQEAGGEPDPSGSQLEGLTLDTILQIGVVDGEPWEVFGRIDDVAVREDGVFAVHDNMPDRVLVYDPSGRFVAQIDQEGEGPGEIGDVASLFWGPEGRLYLLDRLNARVSVFALEGDGLLYRDPLSYRFDRGLGLSSHACDLNGRLFVSALWEGGIVHEVSPDGSLVQSFSALPEFENTEALGPFLFLVNDQAGLGMLLCDAEGDRVLEVGGMNPRAQLFTADGERIWEGELNDVRPTQFFFEDGRFSNRDDPEAGSHYTQSLLRWDTESVLIQHSVRFPLPTPEDRDHHALESRLIRLDTGVEIARTSEIPQLFAIHGDRLFHVRNTPFPQLMILER